MGYSTIEGAVSDEDAGWMVVFGLVYVHVLVSDLSRALNLRLVLIGWPSQILSSRLYFII